MEKKDGRKETRRWPPWLTWSAVCGVLLGVIQLPDTLDQLKRWPEVVEKMDTGTLYAIAFILVLVAIAGLISWPLHYVLVERGARKRDRLEALAEEVREAEEGIDSALDRGDRLVPSGAVHRLKGKLEEMDIPTPPLLSPRIPMPRPVGQKWYDFLVRVGTAAELRDLKAARNAWFEAQLDWRLVVDAFSKTVAEQGDAEMQADTLEMIAKELREEVGNDPETS